jgi:hypothetical protein
VTCSSSRQATIIAARRVPAVRFPYALGSSFVQVASVAA